MTKYVMHRRMQYNREHLFHMLHSPVCRVRIKTLSRIARHCERYDNFFRRKTVSVYVSRERGGVEMVACQPQIHPSAQSLHTFAGEALPLRSGIAGPTNRPNADG